MTVQQKKITLSGTITTGEVKTGQYTCRQTSADATCETLLYIDECDRYGLLGLGWGSCYVLPLTTNSHYSQFGVLPFNKQYSSLSNVGYMYNNRYVYNRSEKISTEKMLSTASLSTDYWYADLATWDSPYYQLVSPYQISSTADYPNLVGKYTLESTGSTNEKNSAYYIAAVKGSTMYYILLKEGNNLSYYNYTYTYGDSYVDNGDGTYTINSPITIERKNWYSNYSKLSNKYVCKNATNNTCSDLWYVTSTSTTAMEYIKVNAYKYAKDFEYKIDSEDGTYKYFLKDDGMISFWDITDSTNQESLNNAHYTCFNTTGKCTKISYIYYLDETYVYYINIEDGKSVEDAKNEILYNDDVNEINSTIKTGIDLWYEKYLLKYSDYLEDTIFCNDRSQSNSATNGWNPNGGSLLTKIYFNGSSDLNCPSEVDSFSTLNDKAKLKYKVGLMSYREMDLLGNDNARSTVKIYWTVSPFLFQGTSAGSRVVKADGSLSGGYYLYSAVGVRPAISLKPSTEYVDGDGSMANPYIIETN
mgnify:FL=1